MNFVSCCLLAASPLPLNHSWCPCPGKGCLWLAVPKRCHWPGMRCLWAAVPQESLCPGLAQSGP